jgi:hypothetical protein
MIGERVRVEASAGPIQHLAIMTGTEPETGVRWLIRLMVLCRDPAAIALTVAATARDERAQQRKLTPQRATLRTNLLQKLNP